MPHKDRVIHFTRRPSWHCLIESRPIVFADSAQPLVQPVTLPHIEVETIEIPTFDDIKSSVHVWPSNLHSMCGVDFGICHVECRMKVKRLQLNLFCVEE